MFALAAHALLPHAICPLVAHTLLHPAVFFTYVAVELNPWPSCAAPKFVAFVVSLVGTFGSFFVRTLGAAS
jgi:hypothetical protein